MLATNFASTISTSDTGAVNSTSSVRELSLLGHEPHGDQRRGQHEQHEHLEEDVHQARLMD